MGVEHDDPPFDVEYLDAECVDVAANDEYEPEPETLDAIHEHAEWFDTLPPERQAAELNHCSDVMESSTVWVAVDGEVTAQGSAYADFLKQRGEQRQRRQAAIASRRTRLAGIVTPVACRRARGRAHPHRLERLPLTRPKYRRRRRTC
jgi:hypothetical protein